MKKIFYTVLLFIIGLTTVNAYSLTDYANEINTNDLTKQYIEKYKARGIKATVKASTVDNSNINVSFAYENDNISIGYELSLTLNPDTGIIEGSSSIPEVEFDKDQEIYLKESLNLLTYYPAFVGDSGEKMNKELDLYIKYKKDTKEKPTYLSVMEEIFDTCNMGDYGTCVARTEGYVDNTTIKEKERVYNIHLNSSNTSSEYALKWLQEANRKERTSALMVKILMVAGVIAVLFVIAWSAQRQKAPKPIKY
jgi:hypothetical protein